ncbi:MAG TPA: CpsD/CapB family tyrosine-protein kinase [Clostridia bacterium]|nr:CpsD/CapB family tyrosine-protein kinase [Clostridia bacterium]
MSRTYDLLHRFSSGHSMRESGDFSAAAAQPAFDSPEDARSRIISEPLASEISRFVQRSLLPSPKGAPQVVVFSAVQTSEEADPVCACTSEVLARSGASVCVLDVNHEQPSLHEYFSVSNQKGFADAVRNGTPLADVAHRVPGVSLTVIPSGTLARDTNDVLFSSPQLQRRVGELRKIFNFVLINAPSIKSSAVPILLGRLADSMVLVVEADYTNKDYALKAKQEIDRAGIRLLGAVLHNQSAPPALGFGRY